MGSIHLFYISVFFAVVLQYILDKRIRSSALFELTKEIVSSIGNAALITNHKNEIIYINSAYTKITGFTLDDVFGKNPKVLSSGKQDKMFYKKLWESLVSTGYWEGEIWNRKKSGNLFVEWIHISVIKDKNGRFLYYLAVFSDISYKKAEEEKIIHYAYFDPLTDLPNRRFFEQRLQQEIELFKRNHLKIAILFIDINGFKKINDQFNHEVGDAYLCHIARLIKVHLRSSDIVSRFGGDEFVVALFNVDSSENVMKLCEKLILALDASPFKIENYFLKIKVSIGFAIYPDDSLDIKSLIQCADERMYKEKRRII